VWRVEYLSYSDVLDGHSVPVEFGRYLLRGHAPSDEVILFVRERERTVLRVPTAALAILDKGQALTASAATKLRFRMHGNLSGRLQGFDPTPSHALELHSSTGGLESWITPA
jgi:hypothetical protein